MQFLIFDLLMPHILLGTAPLGVIWDSQALLTHLTHIAAASPRDGPVLSPSPVVGSEPSDLHPSPSLHSVCGFPRPSSLVDQMALSPKPS